MFSETIIIECLALDVYLFVQAPSCLWNHTEPTKRCFLMFPYFSLLIFVISDDAGFTTNHWAALLCSAASFIGEEEEEVTVIDAASELSFQ